MKNVLKIAAIATASFIAATSAQAASNVTGTTTATFTDAKPSTATFTGIGTNAVTWGVAADGAKVNQMTFAANTPFSATVGQQFKVGSLSYYNGTVNNGTELNSLGLNLGFNFSDPAIGAFTKSFMMKLNNTPNTGTADENADYVTFDSLVTSDIFTVNGQSYTFQLKGFTNVVGDGFLDSTAREFHVREGGNASADVFGVLNVAAVPEPATWAMMLVGFGMVAGATRYRRRSTNAVYA
ncbi:choice-of-anchor K domain-containing protein [Sphingomonas sp. KR1UV-12]|uniref:Choice-of-anchor K domain-containing protein n=1 Tax=Sphingomonas aurea TaxID=3063994 RepID=A0ABT9ELP6_9SPHN|nr:choice-of-anchor K domain-containing protein [Sphingomonas sp. KR1UV-12]MDP1027880.1 choice-of-anchor K domain-containing protein [Sphingomonas sp. KR1UV-12]